MMAEKKAREVNANPGVNAFMKQMADKDKEQKAKEKVDALNPRLQNNKEPNAPTAKANPSERVPEAAKTIKDKEGMEKEIADLKKQYKQLFFES